MDELANASSAGIYSIGAVSRMLGIPTQTLRVWEDRYDLVVPVRSAGGQRLYSRDQVEQLGFIKGHVGRGLQPADAHRLLAQRDSEAGTTAPMKPVDEPVEPSSVTVLIAERDPYAGEFADYFLRTEGYTVRVVLTADDAARVLETDSPKLLVVDLMISGGAGLDLCIATRKSSAVPILALSTVDSRDQALRAGVDAFLHKPIEPLQFVSTVRDLIGTSAYLLRGIPHR